MKITIKLTLVFVVAFVFSSVVSAQSGKTKSNPSAESTLTVIPIGKVEKVNDEFKSKMTIHLTKTNLSPDTAFTLEIEKDKMPMDNFTRDVVADTAPVMMQLYVSNLKEVVSTAGNEVNFLADGQQVSGGALRRKNYSFASFKNSGIDDPYTLITIGNLKKIALARSVKIKIADQVFEMPRPVIAEIKNFISEYLK